MPANVRNRSTTIFFFTALFRAFLLAALVSQVGQTASCQVNQWIWMGGSSVAAQPGVYGEVGKPTGTTYPGARHDGAHWVDKDGNFWIFGGIGFDSAGNLGKLNDLWKYDVLAGEWTWISGSSTLPTSIQCPSCGRSGFYGALTKAASENTPGARVECINWTDKSGNLWLFGGQGYDSVGIYGGLNDLWMFSPSSGQWTWMGGSDTVPVNTDLGPGNMSSIGGSSGVYGDLGKPDPGDTPGGRGGGANWTDSIGNLWLLGGYGWITPSNLGDLNDLWEYITSTNEWVWMGGSDLDPPSTGIDPGVYGGLGSSSSSYIPTGRDRPASWTDQNGNFWLFGGNAVNETSTTAPVEDFNDLWMFNPSTQEWTWVSGADSPNQAGSYGTLGVASNTQVPGARSAGVTWTDASGNLWLFGGIVNNNATGPYRVLNDLWVYNPAVNEWVWMGGTAGIPNDGHCSPCGSPGAYGAMGVADGTNVPGGRYDAASWVDGSGNFWLFGGWGIDSNDLEYPLNDLWEYKPSAPVWTASIPSFSGPAGSYNSAQTVSIAELTPGATIYYTLDGSTPTTASPQYSHPLTITKTTTLNALAAAPGLPNSSITTALYTILYPQSISFSGLSSRVTYGVRAIPLKANATSGLSVTFSVRSGPGTLNGSTLIVHGIGEIVVVANQAGSSNYLAAQQVEQTIHVEKATLTVAANATSKVYGEIHPKLTWTISGFVDGDTEDRVVTGAPRLITTATESSPVGSYPIHARLGTLQSHNYSFQFESGVLRVKKAKLVVAARNQNIKRGRQLPRLTYALDGLVIGDTARSATTGLPRLTTPATSKSPPGIYPIKVSVGTLAAKNYFFETENGTLTIQP